MLVFDQALICISLRRCTQANKRVTAGPAARHHPEDIHVQPHPSSAPLHHPHGVYEEERAGECGATHQTTNTSKQIKNVSRMGSAVVFWLNY